MSDLARELEGRIEGEVRFDRYSRLLYSTDASIYQVEPLGVVIPKHRDDIEQTIRLAAQAGVPVLPRGGGTSLAGQAVGEAVVLDLSKYMNRVLDLNMAERWVTVQPGVVQDGLGAYLKLHGARFGPDTATSDRATLGGMIGNNSAGAHSLVYGKTVDNVLEVRTILADGTEAVFGPVWRQNLESKTKGDSLEARIYRTALSLAEEYRSEIEKADAIRAGDALGIDPLAGRVENRTTGETLACEPLPPHLMAMVADGGLLAHLEKRLRARG